MHAMHTLRGPHPSNIMVPPSLIRPCIWTLWASHTLRDNILRLDCVFVSFLRLRMHTLSSLSLGFGAPHTLRSLSHDLGGHSLLSGGLVSRLRMLTSTWATLRESG